jgi:hypothetical protein
MNQALRRLKLAKAAFNQSALEHFISKVQVVSQQSAELEELLGNDAPEEFLCGICYDLMREPVQLPNSGTICDFRNIK